MFRETQNENKRSYCIGVHVWNDLSSHWNAPKYRSKYAYAKKKMHLFRVGVYTQVAFLVFLSIGRLTLFGMQLECNLLLALTSSHQPPTSTPSLFAYNTKLSQS